MQEGRGWKWRKGGAQEAASAMKVAVPSAATDLRGAIRDNFQDSAYLLAFVVPDSDVNAFVNSLHALS
ncbi:hypothetical protein [Streptomyces sp. NPDC051219]|uniref:hypothetical protein n=1 Tax=Streptomyces sp. NPDC051219 TaxID=3155283 RepID=UPI0034211169